MFKKSIKSKLLLSIAATFPIATVVACGANATEAGKSELYKSMESDPLAVALKTTLSGYSTEPMEIIANKQEISADSRKLIEEFNAFYGTKLSFTQIGGAQDYGTFLTTKFANGTGNVLLVGAGSANAYRQIDSQMKSSPVEELLSNITDVKQQISVNNKKFMPATLETFGLIYNKDLFTQKNIVVFEGKKFEEATDKPVGLQKPTDYNGTIVFENKLYVFTDDLKRPGHEALNKWLEEKNVKPIYTTSKTTRSNIWPVTNHLLGATIAVKNNLSFDSDKLMDPNSVITPALIESMKKALEIYGHNKPYNAISNTVDKAMQSVAVGAFGMSQNGTWATPQIKAANKDVNIGFLPMPVYDNDDETALIFKGVSQWWGVTNLASDAAKLKTAQLFLRFLYQTKSGLEYATNTMGFTTPYNVPTNANFDIKDPLLNSSSNYNDEDISSAVDNYLVSGFNNGDEVLVNVTNGGFEATDTLNRLIAEYKKLVDAKK
ncbi:ABC transporter substrate-binding protein [Candidatus Mycoplasma pogonae]